MMQEAKRSCRGAWYLPTGRLEKEETLEVSSKISVNHLFFVLAYPLKCI